MAGHLATKYLGQNGMLLFTGASLPFENPTPNSLAYSLAKTSVHYLVMSLSLREDITIDSDVIGILP